MSQRPNSIPDILLKPINPQQAPARGLNALFHVGPDKSDEAAYVREELYKKIAALDAFLGLDSSAPNVMELRASALFGYFYGWRPQNVDSWVPLLAALLRRHLRGFLIERRGRPRKWTIDQRMCLLEDANKIMSQYPDFTREQLFIRLQMIHPCWRNYSHAALQKAYKAAKKFGQNFPKPVVRPSSVVSAARLVGSATSR